MIDLRSFPHVQERVVSMSHRFWTGVALACCYALFTLDTVFAQDDSAADAREVNEYILTEDGLAKFSQAAANLGQLGESLSGTCDDDGEAEPSLDGMVAQIRAVPGAAGAIESAGLPVHEYVVFTFAMIQAGFAAWALDQPGGELAPGVSMANVEFYRAHEAELQEAANLVPSDDCDEGGDDSYDESDYEE
jgi:hypothetical protein